MVEWDIKNPRSEIARKAFEKASGSKKSVDAMQGRTAKEEEVVKAIKKEGGDVNPYAVAKAMKKKGEI